MLVTALPTPEIAMYSKYTLYIHNENNNTITNLKVNYPG